MTCSYEIFNFTTTYYKIQFDVTDNIFNQTSKI